MLPINYQLIGSIPALDKVYSRFDNIEILFNCYSNVVKLEKAIRDVAAHYYGIEAGDTNELILAINAYEHKGQF